MKNWRVRPGLATRLGTVPLVCLLALGAGVPFVACSSEPLDHAGEQQAGSLGLNLQVGSGVTVNTVTYSITGNGFSKTGTIDTSGSPTIHLKGTATSGNGSVLVNGTLNVGPVVDELTVTPLQVYVGSTVSLTGVAK